jgi:hypothetical protein
MRGSYRGRPHGPRCTVLVKVNGPAFGAGLTSHDLTEVHEAIAAEEVDKINCAVEKGSKVLLYLDDIGRGTWKLLQKFTSMTDAQRRMEGVGKGTTRTWWLAWQGLRRRHGRQLLLLQRDSPVELNEMRATFERLL